MRKRNMMLLVMGILLAIYAGAMAIDRPVDIGAADPGGTDYTYAGNDVDSGSVDVIHADPIASMSPMVINWLIPLLVAGIGTFWLRMKARKREITKILLDIWNVIVEVDALFSAKVASAEQFKSNFNGSINAAKKDYTIETITKRFEPAKKNTILKVFGTIGNAVEAAFVFVKWGKRIKDLI